MTNDSKIAGAVFGFSASAILALATLCTRALSMGASPKWRVPFHAICHGIERRCFVMWDVPMPICSRCVGIYAGMLAALALFATVAALRPKFIPTVLLVILVAPLALDGVSQAFGVRESTNALRLATGLIAGFAFMFWAITRIEVSARERRDAALQR